MTDFTPQHYKSLLEALLKAGFQFLTFEQYCREKPKQKFCILRHDVDKKPALSLGLAKIEAALGIEATYYFRIVPESNQPEFIEEIAKLGHEIAYHYEDLSLTKGDVDKAHQSYRENLEYFRSYYPVKTISMHGSPAGKYDNRDVWKKFNYRDYGIIGEPYFDFIDSKVNNVDGNRFYFTDTGGMWDGDRYNVRDKAIAESGSPKVTVHTTQELIDFLVNSDNIEGVMINTHPQRWTDSRVEWWMERITQKLKNRVKAFLVKRNS